MILNRSMKPKEPNLMYRILLSCVCGVVLASPAAAHNRKFPWLYDPGILPVGEVEYEQWVTLKRDKQSDSNYEEWKFRHEIEWGATENLQLAIYLADWRYKQDSSRTKVQYRDVAFEAIYALQKGMEGDPDISVYGEIKVGDELIELEGKGLFQWDIGQTTLLYNLTLEAEWEGRHYNEDKGKLENAVAIGWQLEPTTTVGIQALYEVEFDDWAGSGEGVLYVGPSLSYQRSGWFISLSPLFQVTDVDTAADLQVRLLAGIDF
jgi:hypothetical protein